MAMTEELVGKRRDLVNRRRALKAELTSLAKDISALDHVLRMLDPRYRPEAPAKNRSRTPDKAFIRGEMSAIALDTLRQIGEPVSAADCARRAIEDRGLSSSFQAEVSSNFSAVFAKKAEQGQVRRVSNGDSRNVKWEIAR